MKTIAEPVSETTVSIGSSRDPANKHARNPSMIPERGFKSDKGLKPPREETCWIDNRRHEKTQLNQERYHVLDVAKLHVQRGQDQANPNRKQE